ncbi:hypothetical protein D9V37_08085 [Nocardioides mangrovicus]|uniref:M23ase beta-sheet core domain-containing protein n=1 Tax=Nocardioides mangrovicus TaxID=2478913 RepID=A0A3L8P473_9ACTN|nr:M23 family metallopeptidase [Nocardioides mangrovicus]RLV49837.1 hypothetical protein D9V37_08085 [Nocardioides mangrovicus]
MEKPHPLVKRALVTASLVALVTAGTLAPSANADDHLKHKKKQVEAHISSAQADLDESSHAAVAAYTKLQSAKTQLGGAQQKLATTQSQLVQAQAVAAQVGQQLAAAQAQLVTATAKLRAGEQRVVDQRSQVARMAAQSVQGIDPRVVGLVALVSDDDPANLSDQMQGVGNAIDHQSAVLAGLRTAEEQLRATRKQVKQAKDDVAKQQAAAEANVAEQQRLTNQAAADEQSVVALIGQRRSAARQAKVVEKTDRQKLKQLQAEDAKIEKQLKAQAAHAQSYSNSGPLLMPAQAAVTSPFGWREHPIYHYWGLHDGVDLGVGCDTPLKASGNGKVTQEYYSSVWGNRLFLDLGKVNGHAITVIYNHLTSYKTSVGESVTRGQTVALSGTTGWSTGCHLHFTVMVDGQPQDPMKWF